MTESTTKYRNVLLSKDEAIDIYSALRTLKYCDKLCRKMADHIVEMVDLEKEKFRPNPPYVPTEIYYPRGDA